MKKNTAITLFESELILAHILKKSREYVLAHPEIKLTKKQETTYKKLIKRREDHEPMAYILGHKEFYGLNFKVDKNTLTPRPETELLVEEVLKKILDTKYKIPNTIIDIGTGSGNIIISIAKVWTSDVQMQKGHRLSLYGIDISSKALQVAKYNARKNKVDKKINFFKSDMLRNKKLLNEIKNKDLIITANLPYLSEKIYDSTAPDVKSFEPKTALLSGKDGLDHYKKLLQQIKNIFDSRSLLTVHCFWEISPEQKNKLEKIIKKLFSQHKLSFKKDLAGKWRLAILEI